MGSSAASANMGHGLNTGMPGLGACAMPDSKPMQFPLAQRRKRRVLFTQAQVCLMPNPHPSMASSGLSNYRFHQDLKYYIGVGGAILFLISTYNGKNPSPEMCSDCVCRFTSSRGGSSSKNISRPLKESIWPR